MFFIFLCCNELNDDDRKEITEIYKELMPKIYNLCNARLNDPNYVEDIVQSSFLLLVKKYNSLNHNNLYYWLLQVADNLVKNENRLNQNRESIISLLRLDDIKDEEYICFENTSYVTDIVTRELSKIELEIFDTYFVLCESHEEAAKKYNISINASKARKARIRLKIIQILKKYGITSTSVK